MATRLSYTGICCVLLFVGFLANDPVVAAAGTATVNDQSQTKRHSVIPKIFGNSNFCRADQNDSTTSDVAAAAGALSSDIPSSLLETARAIKNRVEQDPKLRSTSKEAHQQLTDLEYLQLAVQLHSEEERDPKLARFGKDDNRRFQASLNTIQSLQQFRKTHGIDETLSDAKKRVTALFQRYPGLHESMGVDNTGRAVLFTDYSSFTSDRLRSSKEWDEVMGGFYYVLSSTQANPGTVQQGTVFCILAGKLGWSNINIELQNRFATLYSKTLPMTVREISMLTGGSSVIKTLYGIVKVFVAKRVRAAVVFEPDLNGYLKRNSKILPNSVIPEEVGGTFPKGTILPTIFSKLDERFNNMKLFKL